MSKVKFVLDSKGVSELLRSEEMQKLMKEEGEEVLGRLPDIGFGMHVAVTSGQKSRAQVTVGTRSVYSERHNSKHRTLQKALGGSTADD